MPWTPRARNGNTDAACAKMGSMKATVSKMTYDQYCLLPEDGYQYEVFDGELVMTPAPIPKHQRIVLRLARILDEFVEKNRLGQVYVSPIDIVFDRYTILQPDIIFIKESRLHIVGEEAIEGAPDLVVEVLSRSTLLKDRVRKLQTYSEFGVLEYWIVDPIKQVIELYERAGEELQFSKEFSSRDTLESPLLSGFQLPVARIF